MAGVNNLTTLSSPTFTWGRLLGTAMISNWAPGVFLKYSLGGDTTMLSGLYASLCHKYLDFAVLELYLTQH